MILFVPIISIVLLTLILIFLSLGLNLFSPVYLTLLIMVVLIPIALLRYYFEYSYAPIQVGFSELGFLVKYREKNQNPMLLDYVWWDDIADVKELEELDSFRTGDIFKKGEKQKYIVILKKSGINKVLGPIDIELADKIKSRAGK